MIQGAAPVRRNRATARNRKFGRHRPDRRARPERDPRRRGLERATGRADIDRLPQAVEHKHVLIEERVHVGTSKVYIVEVGVSTLGVTYAKHLCSIGVGDYVRQGQYPLNRRSGSACRSMGCRRQTRGQWEVRPFR